LEFLCLQPKTTAAKWKHVDPPNFLGQTILVHYTHFLQFWQIWWT
jgi:hypothetical protein